jgi:hypothetical protein
MAKDPPAYVIPPTAKPSVGPWTFPTAESSLPRDSGNWTFAAGFAAASAIALGLWTEPRGSADAAASARADVALAAPERPPLTRAFAGAEDHPRTPPPSAGDDRKDSGGSPATAAAVPFPGDAAAPRLERRVLTSFDETRSMSSGDAPPAPKSAAPVEALPAPPAFRTPPVVWNNSVRWISIHRD